MTSKGSGILIPDWLLHKMADAEAEFCQRVGKRDPTKSGKESASGYEYPLVTLERLLGKDKVKTLRILEIGSGNGFFLCHALKLGLDIMGIEPGASDSFEGRYSRAIELLKLNSVPDPEAKLLNASAESLPFGDNAFDVVFSVAVLEHVRDLDKAMSESIRVLKPEGLLWANLPNYNGIYEAHYNVFWIPGMSKWMAKMYVKPLGRDPSFIDELNFISPRTFRKYLNGKDTYGSIYNHGRWWIDIILVTHNCYKDNSLLPEIAECVGIKKLIVSSLHRHSVVMNIPLGICARITESLGLATTFDLVLHKRIS